MAERLLTGGVLTWGEWHRMYERITEDFGFDPSEDAASRDVLEALVGDDALGIDGLPNASNRTVTIVGAAPGLADEVDALPTADLVLAASDAATVLSEADVAVDVVVTDLDGDPATACALATRGTAIAVHAHGDNRHLLDEWVPRIPRGHVFPTTQGYPTDHVANVGGFTDGDRAAFLATAMGADRLEFAGWDFDDPAASPIKRRKLQWAARLLFWLERRRGDRFDVLDGRRARLDIASFPPPEREPRSE